MRRFEQVREDAMQYNKNPIKKPFRATKFSAGYDIFSPIDVVIEPGKAEMIWTNMKILMPSDEFMLLCTTSKMGKMGIGTGGAKESAAEEAAPAEMMEYAVTTEAAAEEWEVAEEAEAPEEAAE